jgi:prophage DNA circulation protein
MVQRGRVVTEKAIQISLKRNNGTIPLFRADTVDEITDLMEQAVVHEKFLATLEALEESLLGKQATPAPAAQRVQTNNQTAAAINNVVNGLGATIVSGNGDRPTRHCLHGKMTAVQGIGQFGVYKAFFCAAPKGATDKCASIYLKKKDSDYESYVPDVDKTQG